MHEEPNERLSVFRVFEISSLSRRVGSKPLLLEAQHLMNFEGRWHGHCVSRLCMRIQQGKEADWPTSPTACPLAARNRVLEVACEMFAEAGFHGTHFREISKRAGTNVAGICYHFRGKEGLYQAVMMEAGRRLSDRDEDFLASCAQLPPEQRLLKLVESLLQRLSAQRAWIPKLLARELVDPACGAHTYVASGLERDFVMFQGVMRDLLVTGASSETIPLHALRLIGECVLYCLAAENPHHPLVQLAVGLPKRAHLAGFLTERSLAVLQREQTFSGNCT
jgi:AcrR family transcriptional regulator